MKREYVLYDSMISEADLDIAMDCLEDLEDYEPSADDIYDQAYFEKQVEFEDFETLLKTIDKDVNLDIIALADVGRWNGRFNGYKELKGLGDILNVGGSIQDLKYFIDGKDLKSVQYHHDGRNYIVYRLVKPYISDYIYDKILNGSEKHIKRYTSPLGDIIKSFL